MGTQGMKYSLVSREVIADSIETVMGCELLDGLVAIGGCDKNMPGCMMAIARINRPSVFVYGGTILPGCFQKRERRHRVGVRGRGRARAGQDGRRATCKTLEQCAIPGPGSCGGMYTANTMACAIEALGMSLPNSSAQNAISPRKEGRRPARRRGRASAARARHPPARHHDAQGVRERHHGGHRARRLDQRRAAPARHRPLRRA